MTLLQRSSQILALTLVGLISGCATLNKDQCLQANWRQIGFADGNKGEPGHRIEEHAQACAEFGVRPRLDEYLEGRRQGLYSYCQAANGFQVGRSGKKHVAGDCAPHLQSAFLHQYAHGYEIYRIEKELKSKKEIIHSNQRKLSKHDERIAVIRAELARKDLSAETRTNLLNEFNRIVELKNALSKENMAIQPDVEHLQYRLRSRMQEIAY